MNESRLCCFGSFFSFSFQKMRTLSRIKKCGRTRRIPTSLVSTRLAGSLVGDPDGFVRKKKGPSFDTFYDFNSSESKLNPFHVRFHRSANSKLRSRDEARRRQKETLSKLADVDASKTQRVLPLPSMIRGGKMHKRVLGWQNALNRAQKHQETDTIHAVWHDILNEYYLHGVKSLSTAGSPYYVPLHTYSKVMAAYGHVGEIQGLFDVYEFLQFNGFVLDSEALRTVLDSLSKHGRTQEAHLIIEQQVMPLTTVFKDNALKGALKGLLIGEDGQETHHSQLSSQKMIPDQLADTLEMTEDEAMSVMREVMESKQRRKRKSRQELREQRRLEREARKADVRGAAEEARMAAQIPAVNRPKEPEDPPTVGQVRMNESLLQATLMDRNLSDSAVVDTAELKGSWREAFPSQVNPEVLARFNGGQKEDSDPESFSIEVVDWDSNMPMGVVELQKSDQPQSLKMQDDHTQLSQLLGSEPGTELSERIRLQFFELDLPLLNSVLLVCSKSGNIRLAVRMIEAMIRSDASSNPANKPDNTSIRYLFDTMKRSTSNIISDLDCNNEDNAILLKSVVNDAVNKLSQMLDNLEREIGVTPDAFALTAALACLHGWNLTCQSFARRIAHQINNNDEHNNLHQMDEIVEEIAKENLTRGLQMFYSVVRKGVIPNEYVFCTLFSLCADAKDLETCQRLRNFMVKNYSGRFVMTESLISTWLQCAAKARDWSGALQFYRSVYANPFDKKTSKMKEQRRMNKNKDKLDVMAMMSEMKRESELPTLPVLNAMLVCAKECQNKNKQNLSLMMNDNSDNGGGKHQNRGLYDEKVQWVRSEMTKLNVSASNEMYCVLLDIAYNAGQKQDLLSLCSSIVKRMIKSVRKDETQEWKMSRMLFDSMVNYLVDYSLTMNDDPSLKLDCERLSVKVYRLAMDQGLLTESHWNHAQDQGQGELAPLVGASVKIQAIIDGIQSQMADDHSDSHSRRIGKRRGGGGSGLIASGHTRRKRRKDLMTHITNESDNNSSEQSSFEIRNSMDVCRVLDFSDPNKWSNPLCTVVLRQVLFNEWPDLKHDLVLVCSDQHKVNFLREYLQNELKPPLPSQLLIPDSNLIRVKKNDIKKWILHKSFVQHQ